MAAKGKEGKKFEEDIKNSFDDQGLYYLRFKDTSSSYANNSKSRFTNTNPCDFATFNIYNNKILYLECKSTNQASLPFNNIKPHQLDDMVKVDEAFNYIESYFLINFRRDQDTFLVRTKDIRDFYYSENGRNPEGRKSIPKSYIVECAAERGAGVVETLKRTRFRYDLKSAMYRIALLNS